MQTSNTGYAAHAVRFVLASLLPLSAACGGEAGALPSLSETSASDTSVAEGNVAEARAAEARVAEAPATVAGENVASHSQALAGTPFCWLDSYGRGVGAIPNACPAGKQYDAGLCYEPCQPGYYGVGPVCWQACPAGYTDDGAFCRKDAHIFGADNSRCPWYDVCGLTFARGCSTCPEGYQNDGCTCRRDAHIFAKGTYGRGVGTPMVCSGGQQYDAGLCYNACRGSYNGIGPVCWGQCPASLPVSCGASCARSAADCANVIINQITSTVQMAANIGQLVLTAGGSAAATYTAKIALGAGERAAARAAMIQALRETGKDLSESALQNLADQMLAAAEEGRGIDWALVDPTGVAAVVQAFSAPVCSQM